MEFPCHCQQRYSVNKSFNFEAQRKTQNIAKEQENVQIQINKLGVNIPTIIAFNFN